MRRVIIESPFAGDIERNIRYARMCVRDALSRGEAPIASHLLYTQEGILRDEVPGERQWGIDAGLTWGKVADATVVYMDLGVSVGMDYGIAHAYQAGRSVNRRWLGVCMRCLKPKNRDKEKVGICDACLTPGWQE